MILSIYKKAWTVCMKKPLKLWGITLLVSVLELIAMIGFGPIVSVSFCVCLALSASMAMIYLNYYRDNIEPKTTDLFQTFCKGKFLRVVGGLAWMELWVFLWALIPIVGFVFAIIRTYEYRFTPYILMTRDDVKATEAIKVSKELTMGYKGAMFGADVFIVLGFWVAVLILSLLGAIPYVGVVFTIVLVLASILFAILSPLFYGLVGAAFYVEATAKPAAPAPQAPVFAPTPAPTAPQAQVVTPAPAPVTPAAPAPAAPAAPEAPQTQDAPEASAPSVPPRPRFCPNCGKPVVEGQRFCVQCGNKL